MIFHNFFFSSNLDVIDFDIEKPPGFSAHFLLSSKVSLSKVSALSINKKIAFYVKKYKEEHNKIKNNLKNCLVNKNGNIINNLSDFINDLRNSYKPHIKTPKGKSTGQHIMKN